MRNAIIAVVVLIVLGVGGWLIFGNNSNKQNNSSTTANNPSSSQSTTSNSAQNQSKVATNQVTIQNFAFSPQNITVTKGTMVTWTNNDNTAHTVTADSGSGPNSQSIQPGKSYSFTFNQTGTFSYHCSIHPEMTGSVTVTDTTSSSTNTNSTTSSNSSSSSNPY